LRAGGVDFVLEGSRIGLYAHPLRAKSPCQRAKILRYIAFQGFGEMGVLMEVLFSCSGDRVLAIRSPLAREIALPRRKNPALDHLVR
jgi:hypothetical protein